MAKVHCHRGAQVKRPRARFHDLSSLIIGAKDKPSRDRPPRAPGPCPEQGEVAGPVSLVRRLQGHSVEGAGPRQIAHSAGSVRSGAWFASPAGSTSAWAANEVALPAM